MAPSSALDGLRRVVRQPRVYRILGVRYLRHASKEIGRSARRWQARLSGRLHDPALRPIAEKVLGGRAARRPPTRRTLYATADLLGLGRLADFANQRRNGDRVFFSANQHINPTNVCILRNTCVFCSFARMPKEEGAYTRSLEEVFDEAEQARGDADPRVPHRRRAAPQAPAELLHRHDPGAQGAPPRTCTSRR